MKDYKATRKEVENLVNTKILPSIKAHHIHGDAVDDIANRAGIINFMYSVGRMSALESLLRLFVLDAIGKDYENVIDAKIREYFGGVNNE